MFSSQLDAASEAHIARGYVPCTPATLCLHPLHPCNAPLHPSYPALMLLLPILQFWMFSDYLLKSNICNVKLLPQMSATLHLSYFPDSPEPYAHPPFLHLLAEASSRLKVSPACIQGATGCLHSPVPSTAGEDAVHPSLTCCRMQARRCKTHCTPVIRFHLILHP